MHAANSISTPQTPSRKVTRDVNEDARDQARSQMGTPELDRSRDNRKKVEMRFAHLRTHHRFERMHLRGLSGARDEFYLAAIARPVDQACDSHSPRWMAATIIAEEAVRCVVVGAMAPGSE
jgi:hypothetical protein